MSLSGHWYHIIFLLVKTEASGNYRDLIYLLRFLQSIDGKQLQSVLFYYLFSIFLAWLYIILYYIFSMIKYKITVWKSLKAYTKSLLNKLICLTDCRKHKNKKICCFFRNCRNTYIVQTYYQCYANNVWFIDIKKQRR